MLLANNIINDALGLLGYISFGEAPEAEASQLAARTLQGMLAEFAIQDQINPKIVTTTIDGPFAVGNGQYITVGSANPANEIPFDIMDIVDVKVQMGQVVYNLAEITYEEYQARSLKLVPAVPTYFAFDYQEPDGKIYFHLGAMAGLKAIIMYRPRLTQIVNNQSVINLDLYWQQALTYNLATRLYPYLPGPTGLDPQIIYIAKSSISHIRQRNSKMNMRKARPAYLNETPQSSSFWTSPLSSGIF